MAGIIEIYRYTHGQEIPPKFTVGEPLDLNDQNSPVVSKITFRETGSAFGVRMSGGVFVVAFHAGVVERYIPEREVFDIGYQTKAADAVSTPSLPE